MEKSNFFTIKFHKHQKALKTSKWKKVTYLLIYENYDKNVGFTKLIKVLKPRIFVVVAFK